MGTTSDGMPMFGRGRRDQLATESPSAAPHYAIAKNPAGDVLGLWVRDEELAHNVGLIDAILAQHQLWDQVEMGRRIVPNTQDERGGMLILFEPPSNQGGPDIHRDLEVDGETYPIHDRFESFTRDAAAGRISLFRTTFAGLSPDHQSGLFKVLAHAFGPDAPQTRASTRTALQCLTCWRGYQASTMLFIRETRASGIPMAGVNSNLEDLRACRNCAGTEAVWIYDPDPPA